MGCIGSCLGSCCAQACCGGSSEKASKNTSRVPYLVIMFLGIILSLVLRFWGKPLSVHIYWIHYTVCGDHCMGYGAVYRVSMVLCIFFLAHYFSFLCGGGLACHGGRWVLKTMSLISAIVLSFLIHDGVFEVYATIARFVSSLFLLIQIIILIDFAYSWNEAWVDKDWKYQILGCCFVMIAASVVLWVFSLDWFTDHDGGDCSRNKFFVAWTIIMTVVFTLLSITEKVERGALLPSAVMMLYCSYLCYSSLASDTSKCNKLRNVDTVQIVIGLILAAFSITYAGWNISNSKTLFGDEADETTPESGGNYRTFSDEKEKETDAENPKESVQITQTQAKSTEAHNVSSDDKEDDDDEADAVADATRAQLRKFHIVMAICAMYMAMVLTNWGQAPDAKPINYDAGETTLWIKIVTQWITGLLYIWTLVAPLMFPDRFE